MQLVRDFQEQSHGRGLQYGPLKTHTGRYITNSYLKSTTTTTATKVINLIIAITLPATIACAAKLVHSSCPCVAILTKPAERLALRTTADALGIAAHLRNVHGIPSVLHISMQDLARSRIDDSGDLNLDGQKISVIYSRYDFSHPTGQFKDNPADGDQESPIAWKDEWDTIEKIEKSNAVSALSFVIAVYRQCSKAISIF